ncbi:MAG: DUF1425 domain-containing protein [Planctomycetota bacterium]
MKAIAGMAAVMALALASAGCNTVAPANVYTYETGKQKPLVEVADSSLAGSLDLGGIVTRDDGGLLTVQAQFKNAGKSPVRCEYKFVFYDANGFEMTDARSRWEPMVFPGNVTNALSATAPSKGAVKAKIYLRKDSAIR